MTDVGHNTMSAFNRHHTIDHQHLHQLIGQLDTYIGNRGVEDGLPALDASKVHNAPVAQADRARDS